MVIRNPVSLKKPGFLFRPFRTPVKGQVHMYKTLKFVISIGLVLILVELCLICNDGLSLLKIGEGKAVRFENLNHPYTRPTPPDIEITVSEVTASGFTRPIQATHAGDGSHRLFVVEQIGRIRVIKNGEVLPAPFLDISHLISCCAERGLLGLAFHPDYEDNGYFYVNYTRKKDGATVIARYSVSRNPAKADLGSASTILTVAQPYFNHNGGQLLFSPVDGYLYIGMGDGGKRGDPHNHGQDKETLLGAMLRLDVDGGTPYAIPPDNPYVGVAGADEIWAIGLRNPWRFSFDQATGDLYIGDVGQDTWEEINYQAAHTLGGLNFGWRCKEGTHPYNFLDACHSARFTDPIATYNHDLGIAVTGGFVYRGNLYPALVGYYFYADFGSSRIWSIRKMGPNTWSTPQQELVTDLNISAFGEDEAGELYVVDYAANEGGGQIRHLADLKEPGLNRVGLK